LTCLSVSVLPPTSRRKLSLSRWLDSMGHTTPFLGAPATLGSWRFPHLPQAQNAGP
jgi:hypothetical protein